MTAATHTAGLAAVAPPTQEVTGVPLLVATLSEGSTSGPADGRCTLQLAPDTMHEARLSSGELVMVALTSIAVQNSPMPAARRSPSSAPMTPSSFGPAASSKADLAAVVPADLWGQCCSSYGCSLSDVVPQGTAVTGPAAPLGRFFVAAHVWPNAKLPRGVVMPSAGLWAAMGRPSGTCSAAVYRAPWPATSGMECTQLQLAMCCEGAPAATAAKSLPPAAAASPATPRTRGRSETPGKAQLPSTPAGGTTAAGAAAAAAAAAAAGSQWPQRLAASSVDWSDSNQRRLLERLALRHLLGRCMLPGNLVPLPVLGRTIMFRVAAAAAANVGSTSSGAASLGPVPAPISTQSSLMLLLPGEEGSAAADAAAGAAADGSSSGSSIRDAVAVAREAARGAAEGSSQEAAVDAAERAVKAGLAASAVAAPLGGVANHLQSLRDLVTLPLTMPQLFARYKLRPPRGVLLHGPPGTGKTALARAAAKAAGAQLLVINGPDIVTEFYGESEAGMRGVFAAARALAPAVLFIDEIDAIAPAREGAGGSRHGGGGSSDASTRMLTAMLTLMDGLGGTHDRVVVLAATNRPSALDPALRRPGRFERELEVGVPSPSHREDILHVRLARMCHSLSPDDISVLAAAAHGFVGADLAALCNEAAMAALRRVIAAHPQQAAARVHSSVVGSQRAGMQGQQAQEQQLGAAEAMAVDSRQGQEQPTHGQAQHQEQQQQQQQEDGGLVVTLADFGVAETRVKPSALREVAVEVPKVGWEDVGGLSGIKQRLKEAIEWPHQHPGALSRLGASPPRGILLYGPPGCSKTLLAKAVAHEAKLNFISIKGGELYSKFVGESEKAVAALFARARAAAPAVVFFDEVDGLAGTRSASGGAESGASVGDRVLAQLLTEMDGLQARLGVVVLAATNRPDRVDPALLRPGRFDRLLFVPPPDEDARREILALHLRRTPLAADVELGAFAASTAVYTGADLGAVCREAALAALEEDMGATCVAARHLQAALQLVVPSAPPSAAMMAIYEKFSRSGVSAAS